MLPWAERRQARPSGSHRHRDAAGVERPVLWIVGDVHLAGGEGPGHPFRLFLAQLAQRPPAWLVILGDLFDYWVDSPQTLARHADVLAQLRALKAAGWRLDLVRGNRETFAGRLFEIASGLRLHWPQLVCRVGGRRVRIVHGDRLCHDPPYHLMAAFLRLYAVRIWAGLHPGRAHDAVARWLRRASRGSGRDRSRDARQGPPRVFIDRRRVQAAGRGVDLVIAGHIHEAWRRRLGGVELMLVGHWHGQQGRWIEVGADGRICAKSQLFLAAAAAAP